MNQTPSESLLDIPALALWLRVKQSTIRKWVCYERIPFLKIGSRVVFRKSDIERWLVYTNPQNTKWDVLLSEPHPRSV